MGPGRGAPPLSPEPPGTGPPGTGPPSVSTGRTQQPWAQTEAVSLGFIRNDLEAEVSPVNRPGFRFKESLGEK